MIITKTPFRISFAGGGTDFREFYELEQGAVLSASINKYMYIAIHRYFENRILLKYSQTELVDSVEQIQHRLIRECFKKVDMKNWIEVTSFADIPSSGTGLGSSSAFTVGMLKALYVYKHENRDNLILAEDACEIEIDTLGEPIGKQDQYACAVGGINIIRFNPDGTVFVEPIVLPTELKNDLCGNLLMFYTGITRSANSILSEQKFGMKKREKFNKVKEIRDLSFFLRDCLVRGDLSSFGHVLHEVWMLKRELASGISNSIIDGYYENAIRLGASGGKLLGAGGGGFLLLYCERDKQARLRAGIGLREMRFGFDPQGARIAYMEDVEDENNE